MDFNHIKKSVLLSQAHDNGETKRIFEVVAKNLKQLQDIDTEGLEPADFPYTIENTFLREDKPKTVFYEDFKKKINTNAEGFVVLEGLENE